MTFARGEFDGATMPLHKFDGRRKLLSNESASLYHVEGG